MNDLIRLLEQRLARQEAAIKETKAQLEQARAAVNAAVVANLKVK